MIRRAKEKLISQYDTTGSFFADALTRMRAHEGFKRYFKNTGWLFFGRMISLGLSFFVGLYVAKYLGPSRYGLLNYVLSFVGLFSFLAVLGIDNILNRELINSPEKRDELLGTGFLLRLMGAVCALVVVLIGGWGLKSEPMTELFIATFSLSFIFQAFNVIDIYFQSRVLSKNTVRAQLGSMIATSLLKVFFVYYCAPIFWFVVVYLFDSVFLAAGLIYSYQKTRLSVFQWRFNKRVAKQMLADSWPLMLAGVAVTVYMKIDQVIIKHLLNDTSVGVYSAAVKLSEIWYFIPWIICSSLFPAIVNAQKTDREIYIKRLTRLYSLMIWIAILIAIPITVFAHFIIISLFGAAYIGAVGPLRIYIWAGVPVFLGAATGYYLLIQNYTKLGLLWTVIGAISNIMLNFLFIPRYGINGSAFATLISYVIATFWIVFPSKTREQGSLILKAFLFK